MAVVVTITHLRHVNAVSVRARERALRADNGRRASRLVTVIATIVDIVATTRRFDAFTIRTEIVFLRTYSSLTIAAEFVGAVGALRLTVACD